MTLSKYTLLGRKGINTFDSVTKEPVQMSIFPTQEGGIVACGLTCEAEEVIQNSDHILYIQSFKSGFAAFTSNNCSLKLIKGQTPAIVVTGTDKYILDLPTPEYSAVIYVFNAQIGGIVIQDKRGGPGFLMQQVEGVVQVTSFDHMTVVPAPIIFAEDDESINIIGEETFDPRNN